MWIRLHRETQPIAVLGRAIIAAEETVSKGNVNKIRTRLMLDGGYSIWVDESFEEVWYLLGSVS